MQAEPEILPNNQEAEQALLGAILRENAVLDNVEYLLADDFFIPAHGRILDAARKMRRNGLVADPVTLKVQFERDGDLNHIGGAVYLAQLCGALVSVRNADAYGQAIAETAQRRRLVSIAQSVLEAATDGGHSVDSIALRVRSALSALDDRQAASDPQSISLHDLAVRVANDAERMAGGAMPKLVRTGIRALDSALGGGLWPGDMTLLAGRPSMGKTTLAEVIAGHVAKAGGHVLFISLEMPGEQLARKDLLRRTKISVSTQLSGPITASDARRLKDAATVVHKTIIVNDRSRLRPSQIERQAQAMLRASGLDLVIIDQAPLLIADRDSRSRYEELTNIFTEIAAMARALGKPVLLLHQLNRANETRENKRPQLSDLRDSGAAEERSRVILFVHRPEYYTLREGPKGSDAAADAEWMGKLNDQKGKAEITIAKHHLAPAPETVHLRFDAARQTFEDRPMEIGGLR